MGLFQNVRWFLGAVGRALAVSLILLTGVANLRAESGGNELPPLVRIKGLKGKEAGALEVPVVHYRGSEGSPSVDFIGAVHIGDESYYKELNKRFSAYDAVLFELVGDPKRLAEVRAARTSSALGRFQNALSELLGLSFQLDIINYSAANFVHADLTPEQLGEAMQARGESPLSLLTKALRLSLDPKYKREAEKSYRADEELEGINPLLIIMRGPTAEERLRIKRMMARSMALSGSFLKALQGDIGLSLIQDRNRAALDVLASELASGKRKLALFYGSGHLEDLHPQLLKRFHLTMSGVEWITAWEIQAVGGGD